MRNEKISSISVEHYQGDVFNLELNSDRPVDEDDLFWIANGVVTHNCFVKDLNALIFVARQLGVDPKMMQAVWEKNLEVRPQRDWEKLVGRAVSEKE
jgi:hypothetical protein